MRLSYRIVCLQLVVTLVGTLAFLLWDTEQAVAAILGGTVASVPTAYFAWRSAVERSPHKLLAAGVTKFGLSCVLLALAVVLFKPAPAGFFATFFVAQLMYVVGPLAFGSRLPGR